MDPLLMTSQNTPPGPPLNDLLSKLDDSIQSFYTAPLITAHRCASTIASIFNHLNHSPSLLYAHLSHDFVAPASVSSRGSNSVHELVKFHTKLSLLNSIATSPETANIPSITCPARSIFYSITLWHIAANLLVASPLEKLQPWGYLWLLCIANNAHHIPKSILAVSPNIFPALLEAASSSSLPSSSAPHLLSAVYLAHIYTPAFHQRAYEFFNVDSQPATTTVPPNLLVDRWNSLFKPYTNLKKYSSSSIFLVLRRLIVTLADTEHLIKLIDNNNNDDTDDDDDDNDYNNKNKNQPSAFLQPRLAAVFAGIDLVDFSSVAQLFVSSKNKCDELFKFLTFEPQNVKNNTLESILFDITNVCSSNNIYQDLTVAHFCASESLFNLLHKSRTHASTSTARDYASELYGLLARKALVSQDVMIPFVLLKSVAAVLGVPENYIRVPEPLKFPYLSIIFETIDSKGDILKNINESQLLCLAVKNLERDAESPMFLQNIVYELATHGASMSLLALFSNLLYLVSTHLMMTLFGTLPPTHIKRLFAHPEVPPLPELSFPQLAPIAISRQAVEAQLESCKDLYHCIPLLVRLVNHSLSLSLANCGLIEGKTKDILIQGEAYMVLGAYSIAYDLARLFNDTHLESTVQDFMQVTVSTPYGVYGRITIVELHKKMVNWKSLGDLYQQIEGLVV